MGEPNASLQWHPTCAPVASSRTDDIWFIDPQIGWLVNSNGEIRKTTNGGASWQPQKQESVYWRCIGFATPQRGWAGTVGAVTNTRRLWETADGGETWELIDARLPAGAPSAICGLSVVNEQVVYASGTNHPNRPAAMVKTVDGGATWIGLEMSEHATLLVDTYFPTPDRGWVVGGKANVPNPTRDDVKPVVLFTADGGTTWENRAADLEFPFGEWGWKIQFLDDQVGFVALENFTGGAILKTINGGRTWHRHVVNDVQGPEGQSNANLEGIGFVNAQHGWVGGWGTADFSGGYSSETLDGGATWQAANDIGGGKRWKFLNRFRFFGDPVTVGYASGDTVYKLSAEPVACPAPEAALVGERLLDDMTPVQAEGPLAIGFTVPPGTGRLTIDVWDRFGDPVRRLVDEVDPAGGHRAVTWDFMSDAGSPLPDGYYILRVTSDGQAESRVVQLKRQS